MDKIKKRKSDAKFLSLLLTACMVFTMIPNIVFAEEGGMTAADLQELSVVVIQNEKIITEGSTLNTTDDIKITISFKVPIKGDWVNNDEPIPESGYFSRGDKIEFEVVKGLELKSETEYVFEQDDIKIGTLKLEVDETTGNTKAVVIFDGEEEVFSGEASEGETPWNNLTCSFIAVFEYIDADASGDGEDQVVEILNKNFTVDVPEAETVISGDKNGVRNGEYIDWAVRVSPSKGAQVGKLDDCTFSDNLKNVGEYVEGSFKIGTTNDISSAQSVTPILNNSILSYNFLTDTEGDRYIFFKTRIPDEKLHATGEQTITNKAEVTDSKGNKEEFEDEVEFSTNWIKKVVASEDDIAGEIAWYITVNEECAHLKNASITDILDSKLDWVSAKYEEWNGDTWVNNKNFTEQPADSKYLLGDISTKGMLTITAKVQEAHSLDHTVYTINNTATFTWEEGPHFGSTSASAYIGFNPISKRGTYNPSTMKINWDVYVRATDTNDDLKVYDLLVYGEEDSFNANSNNYTIEGSTDETLSGILKELTPQYYHKYVAGSFVPDSNDLELEMTVYTIKDANDKAVADLLVVTGKDSNGFTVADNNQRHYQYESLVTNPKFYASNGINDMYNTVALYLGDSLVNKETARVPVSSHMLNKDVMNREDASKDLTKVANANAESGSSTDSYNYKDNSVVFRFHVNANEINSNEAYKGGEALGSLTVLDKLPEGWEFAPFTDEKPYIIYKAETNGTSGKVLAVGSPLTDTSSFLKATLTNNESISFEFTELNGSYLILVKARLTDEALKEYFGKNEISSIYNTAELKHDDEPPYCSDSEEVKISSTVLGKKLDKIENGILKWTLEYKPNNFEIEATEIVDIMDEGLQLRINPDGSLILDDISITELTLNPDGTYTDGEAVSATNDNVKYDSLTRTLTFEIIDLSKAYRFTYHTDVTAEYGTKVNNSAKLMNDENESINIAESYTATSGDATAAMESLGWVNVKKTCTLGQQLEGVEFTLFDKDAEIALYKGLTNVNGEIVIKGLTPGNYILRETATLDGYILDDSAHTIEINVSDEDNRIYTKIDGVLGNVLGVVNAKEGTVGDLTVSKTVSGSNIDTAKEFTFTVTLSDTNVNGTYGDMIFTNGIATFKLAHGDSKTAIGIDEGIQYTVTESEDLGYDVIVNDTGQTTASGTINSATVEVAAFKNIHKEVSVTVTKSWQDGENQDEIRPNEITVKLLADDQVTEKTLALNEGNNWTGSFAGLDKYKNGQEVKYTVEEVAVEGYTSEVTGTAANGYTIINSYTSEPTSISEEETGDNEDNQDNQDGETTSISGEKTWDDENNQDGKRPETITINLMKNGVQFESKEVSEGNDWSWTFDNLAKYENGEEIDYRIIEEAVTDYTPKYYGNNVTNSYTPGKISVTVTKSWQDGENQDGIRPNEITVKLLADGKVTDKTLVLNKGNQWIGSFTNLDEYKNGHKIKYTVEESKVKGYTTAVIGTDEKGYTIINSHTPEPSEKTDTNTPTTSDSGNMILYIILAIISLGGFGVIGFKRKMFK